MEQKTLSKWLKTILIGVGTAGLVVFLYIIPDWGKSMAAHYPEFAGAYWPWLIFIWIMALPCYVVLILGWRIASNIGKDASFCMENARDLKRISLLAAADSAVLFIGNILLMFMNMNHPGILLLSLVVITAGLAFSIAAAVLSHLVRKASDLQEQSDLTI